MLRLAIAVAFCCLACAETLPVRAEAVDPAAYRLEEGQAVLDLALVLESSSSQALAARALEYEVRLGDQIVAVGSAAIGGATGVVLPPGGQARIELPLALSWDQLPAGIARRLELGRSVAVDVRGRVVVRGPGSRHSLLVPFELEGELLPVGSD